MSEINTDLNITKEQAASLSKALVKWAAANDLEVVATRTATYRGVTNPSLIQRLSGRSYVRYLKHRAVISDLEILTGSLIGSFEGKGPSEIDAMGSLMFSIVDYLQTNPAAVLKVKGRVIPFPNVSHF